ncbi:hypothetical protein [Sphingosinicella terrae]|uniref:hypothetical protein n=1 Tax=Sphingosinicella terrae TaxID=2172047 RepID=UPI000E0CE916|nr:hypothetical protein [Sphingosinicella terrae]
MSDWHSGLPTADGGPFVAFYEKVRIRDSAPHKELRGGFGWMLGVEADHGVIEGYQIHFDDLPTGYFFEPIHLEATGEVAPRERFYAGEPIRVRVDQDGRGHIVR